MKLDELRRIRLANHLTQNQLAQKLGYSRAAYSKREIGLQRFDVNDLKILKHELRLSSEQLDDIFFED